MAAASDHSLLCWGAVDSTGAQWASGKFLHQGPPCRSLWLFVDKSRSRSIFRCTRGVNVDSFSVDYPILKSSTFGCTEISPGLPWVGYWGSREKGHDRAREGNGEWSSQAQCSPLYPETSASFNSGSSSTWDCGLSFQFLCKITKWEAPLCRLSKGKSFRWERRYLSVGTSEEETPAWDIGSTSRNCSSGFALSFLFVCLVPKCLLSFFLI